MSSLPAHIFNHCQGQRGGTKMGGGSDKEKQGSTENINIVRMECLELRGFAELGRSRIEKHQEGRA